jgi:hypothetical protein
VADGEILVEQVVEVVRGLEPTEPRQRLTGDSVVLGVLPVMKLASPASRNTRLANARQLRASAPQPEMPFVGNGRFYPQLCAIDAPLNRPVYAKPRLKYPRGTPDD